MPSFRDLSQVTLNVSLLDTFEGAALSFCGMNHRRDHRQLSHKHAHCRGHAVLHRGKHRHGADELTAR